MRKTAANKYKASLIITKFFRNIKNKNMKLTLLKKILINKNINNSKSISNNKLIRRNTSTIVGTTSFTIGGGGISKKQKLAIELDNVKHNKILQSLQSIEDIDHILYGISNENITNKNKDINKDSLLVDDSGN